jgi:SAM-dependent MidA family methyltransferase
MQAALYDEEHGYYSRKDLVRWGRQGDYRTSPERSVLFGSTFAHYFSRLFSEMIATRDRRHTLIEVGPGASHFAYSVLETFEKSYPHILKRLTYVLDEVSQDARELSANRLKAFETLIDFKRLSELSPLDSGIIFANELLDAFPVHRVTLREGNLLELYIDLDDASAFVWTYGPLSDPRLHEYLQRFEIELIEGQIVEINLAMKDWIHLASRVLTNGYVILVDYGGEQQDLFDPARKEGTLRSFTKHDFAADVLSSPGNQDITSSVDWTAVIEFAKEFGFEIVQFERQDKFLVEGGFLEELESRVSAATSQAEAMHLRTSAREMVLPGGMAQSFQVLVLKRA